MAKTGEAYAAAHAALEAHIAPASSQFTEGCCANCDAPVLAQLFCSEACRQTADLIRYTRRCRRDGRWERPDVQEAIQIKIAFVLGGGYPEQARTVPPRIRDQVFSRAEGLCQECCRVLDFAAHQTDAQATIHHVNGSSNDLNNLRALCRRCNLADVQTKLEPVEAGSLAQKLAIQIEARLSAAEPTRLCDDEVGWRERWPALMRSARATARRAAELDDAYDSFDSLTEAGVDEDDLPLYLIGKHTVSFGEAAAYLVEEGLADPGLFRDD
jgi:5-methylcytosine-specific restriction endonuclease McrA